VAIHGAVSGLDVNLVVLEEREEGDHQQPG
jgi:hypothetical protein